MTPYLNEMILLYDIYNLQKLYLFTLAFKKNNYALNKVLVLDIYFKEVSRKKIEDLIYKILRHSARILCFGSFVC